MIDRIKHARQLPDGTHLCGTLTAAHEYGATPQGFAIAAKKAGLKRYAARSEKGQVAYYWIVDEVEELARKRFGGTIAPDDENPFVEAPYEAEGN